jgi:hypothetical protein
VKWLGYYNADGRQDYGDHFAEQAAHTNLYRASLSGVEGRPEPVAFAAELSERAVAAGKKVWLALDMPKTPEEEAQESLWLDHLGTQMEIVDGQVVAIELTDEPNWTPRKAKQMARKVRTALAGAWPDVPLGVTLASQDVLAGKASIYSEAAGYGYMAAEAYLPLGEWEPEAADAEAFRLVKRLKRHCTAVPSFWVVGMSYDRRGRDSDGQDVSFGPNAALKAAQHGTYRGAVAARADALVWFSFGRPGGVVSYPGLKREHRAIARQAGVLA